MVEEPEPWQKHLADELAVDPTAPLWNQPQNTGRSKMADIEVTLKPCGCGNEPVWGYLTAYNVQGAFIRHNAIRCLHCHYWFYINGDKEKTGDRWNEAASHRIAATEAARADVAELVEALGEALHGLSAMLLLTKALDDDKTHAAYEKVVQRFGALAKHGGTDD